MSALFANSTVAAALIGGLVALVGSIVGIVGILIQSRNAIAAVRETAALNQRNEIHHRVWDVRRVGYSIVIYKLYQLTEIAYGDSETCRERGPWASDNKLWAECRSDFANHHLMLSRAFVDAFRGLEAELETVELMEGHSPSGRASDEDDVFRKAYSRLREIALKDLDITEEEAVR